MTPTDRRRGPVLDHGMNVRFSREQYRYLHIVAEREDESLSGALRHLVDQALDAEPRVNSLTPDELAQLPADVAAEHRDSGPTLRQILAWATSLTPDAEWLRKHGAETEQDAR